LADVAVQPAAAAPIVRIMRLAVMTLMVLVKFFFKMNTPFQMKVFTAFIMTGQRVGTMKTPCALAEKTLIIEYTPSPVQALPPHRDNCRRTFWLIA